MKKLVGFVVKAVGTIVVLGIVAGFVFGGGKKDVDVKENNTTATASTEKKEEPKAKYDLKLSEVDTKSNDYMASIEATITNNYRDVSYVQIDIPVKDKNGVKLGEFMGNMSGLKKGEVGKIKLSYLEKLPEGYQLGEPEVSGF